MCTGHVHLYIPRGLYIYIKLREDRVQLIVRIFIVKYPHLLILFFMLFIFLSSFFRLNCSPSPPHPIGQKYSNNYQIQVPYSAYMASKLCKICYYPRVNYRKIYCSRSLEPARGGCNFFFNQRQKYKE